MSKSGQNLVDDLHTKIEWYEAEIERLKVLVQEQDRRAQTTTALFRAIVVKDATTFIVTCPSGDEKKLMRTMFAGIAALSWAGFNDAANLLGLDGARDAAQVLFEKPEGDEAEEESES